MELFLVRHGETVDNVAGLYAGVRDSTLTVHGVEQARRLGQHFAKNAVFFTHIYASPLSRASGTAQSIRDAQPDGKRVDVVQVADLTEQDFGYYEGKPFFTRSEAKKSNKGVHQENHKNLPGFVDVESKKSMAGRADKFLNNHFVPLFSSHNTTDKLVVLIVSHGIFLSQLWRSLLQRLPANSVTINPEVTSARGSIVLQHLGGWSNTGVLHLLLTNYNQGSSSEALAGPMADSNPQTGTVASEPAGQGNVAGQSDTEHEHDSSSPIVFTGWCTLIKAIDSKEHLVGLKRQRGGIGRSAYDEGQKKLDGFFKRQKTS